MSRTDAVSHANGLSPNRPLHNTCAVMPRATPKTEDEQVVTVYAMSIYRWSYKDAVARADAQVRRREWELRCLICVGLLRLLLGLLLEQLRVGDSDVIGVHVDEARTHCA